MTTLSHLTLSHQEFYNRHKYSRLILGPEIGSFGFRGDIVSASHPKDHRTQKARFEFAHCAKESFY